MVIITLTMYVVMPSIKVSFNSKNPTNATIEKSIESTNWDIIVDKFTLSHKYLLFLFIHPKMYVSIMLLNKKQLKLAIHILGVVEKITSREAEATSIELGINHKEICDRRTRVTSDKKPIHTDLRASFAPYFSFSISVANEIEQYNAFPNVIGIPKTSIHFITSMFAIIATIAIQINNPLFPKIL